MSQLDTAAKQLNSVIPPLEDFRKKLLEEDRSALFKIMTMISDARTALLVMEEKLKEGL